MHILRRSSSENLSDYEIRQLLSFLKEHNVYCLDEESCVEQIIRATNGNPSLINKFLWDLWDRIARSSKLSWETYWMDESDISCKGINHETCF